MPTQIIPILIIALVAIIWLLRKQISKAHAKLAPETMERQSVKEFEEANAVVPQRQRWLAFGAPLAYMHKESSRIFQLLPDDYGNAKDLQPLKDTIENMWQVTTPEEARQLLNSNLALECSTPVAQEVFSKFIASHKNKNNPGFGKFLHEEFFVTADDIKDLSGLEASYKAAIKESATAADWHLIKNDITDEEEIKEEVHKIALEYLRAKITGGVKSYGDVIYYLTNPLLENHRHLQIETYEINNFAAYDLGSVAFTARVLTAVGHITEDEAWEYIKNTAEKASGLYSNWHQYVAAYVLGDALAHGSLDSGKNASRMNAYLIGHNNSPLKDVIIR